MKSNIVIKNLKWGLAYQFINMLMGFIAPRFIMLVYGSEINGLQNAILQIINIIALLQAGITSASVFLMYKPLSKGHYKEVAEVLYSAVLYFRKTALVFFAVMLAAAFVFTFMMKSDLKNYEVFISFLIIGLKTTLDILLVSRYLIIFTADQNKYIISIANIIEKIVYYVLLFVIISQKFYFVFMYIGLLVGTLSKIVLYKSRYRKMYGTKLIIDKYNYTYRQIVGKNHSMLNEISHTVVVSSIVIIISLLYDLKSANIYSVYNLVISLLITIDVVIYDSFASSFGHLVAEGNRERINSVFATFQFGFNMINTFLYMCAAYLLVPFVQIYTRGVNDNNYENYLMATMVVIFGIMYTFRIPYNICVSTHGFFKETSMQPIVCCIVSILISTILGKIQMELVIIGPVIFYLINYAYQVCILKKLIPYMDFDQPLKQFITSLCCIAVAIICSVVLPLNHICIFTWIAVAILTCTFYAIFIFIAFFIANQSRCLQVLIYMKNIILSRFLTE